MYVNNTFVLVQNPFDISTILLPVNSISTHIGFTFELEDSNKLSFSDIRVTRCDSFSQTCAYRKFFFVFNPSHILSNHKVNQKIGALHTYVYHTLKISSKHLKRKEIVVQLFVNFKN